MGIESVVVQASPDDATDSPMVEKAEGDDFEWKKRDREKRREQHEGGRVAREGRRAARERSLLQEGDETTGVLPDIMETNVESAVVQASSDDATDSPMVEKAEGDDLK